MRKGDRREAARGSADRGAVGQRLPITERVVGQRGAEAFEGGEPGYGAGSEAAGDGDR
ncbi:hypothetical protein GCM10022220_04160 [Actinocatenispora rupis]|uniref:Uncharacterized protein n=1 Tax=Actinocatenispora rupis TaxID=519421 RepID=A0A8J3J6L6_9ACTN|nr:hypothetical protein Aru02nite_59570 [Actinocatenispora rupis]